MPLAEGIIGGAILGQLDRGSAEFLEFLEVLERELRTFRVTGKIGGGGSGYTEPKNVRARERFGGTITKKGRSPEGLQPPKLNLRNFALAARRPDHRLSHDGAVLEDGRLGEDQLVDAPQKRVDFHAYLPA